jgi:hypothetical protein
MSIILATLTLMLADSLASWGHCRTSDPEKVQRLRGALVGTTGDWGLCDQFFAWYADPDEGALPTGSNDQSLDALIVSVDGLAWSDGKSRGLHPVHEPVWAVGSGMELALGAVYAGACLLEALAIVCERGASCGWPVRWYSLDGREGVITREHWLTCTQLPLLLLERPYPHGLRPAETANNGYREAPCTIIP